MTQRKSEENMAAPPGNAFWKARSSHGRNPIFKKPNQLWKACLEYFDWVDNHPLFEERVFHSGGTITTHQSPKMRAMTIHGLCTFLDICHKTWANYRDKDDFLQVVQRVEQIIYQQKFEGGAADLFNPNIIARDLGLADKKVSDEDAIKTIVLDTYYPSESELKELTDEALEEVARRGCITKPIKESKL